MTKVIVFMFIFTVGAALFAEVNQRVFLSCDQIRQSVAIYGLPAVEQFARSRGVLEADLRRARLACLRD